jgi:hypothetical protein
VESVEHPGERLLLLLRQRRLSHLIAAEHVIEMGRLVNLEGLG